jgi:thioredoxin 1
MSLVVKRFTASWCNPCRALAPIMERVKQNTPGVRFETIDVDEQPDIAKRYGVRSVPLVIIERDGIEVNRSVGVQPENNYVSIINEHK